MSNNEFQLICKNINIIRTKPKNNDDLFKLYINMLRHLMTNDVLIKAKGTTQIDRKVTYKLNVQFINFFIELSKYKNPYLTNFNTDILKLLNL